MKAIGDNVVFMKFRPEKADFEGLTFCTCAHCKNKTFIVTYDGDEFPMMKCAACGSHLGRIGWAESVQEVTGG